MKYEPIPALINMLIFFYIHLSVHLLFQHADGAFSLAHLIDAADDNLKPRRQQLQCFRFCGDLANFGKMLQQNSKKSSRCPLPLGCPAPGEPHRHCRLCSAEGTGGAKRWGQRAASRCLRSSWVPTGPIYFLDGNGLIYYKQR